MKTLLSHRIIEALEDYSIDRQVVDVRLGLKVVAVKLNNDVCGVAYRFKKETNCNDITLISKDSLAGKKAGELLNWLSADISLQRSIGLAVANALASQRLLASTEGQAATERSKIVDGDVFSAIKMKTDDKAAMIGYFEPMVENLRHRCTLEIYEHDTSMAPGLRASSEAPEGLKRCDIALITSTTIVNGSVDQLLKAAVNCREVVMLGPSTPLIPEAFTGTPVTLLSGVLVTDNEVLRAASEGGGMRQMLPFVQKVNLRLNGMQV